MIIFRVMLRPAFEYVVHLETSPNDGTAITGKCLKDFLRIAHVDKIRFPFSVSISEGPSHSIGS